MQFRRIYIFLQTYNMYLIFLLVISWNTFFLQEKISKLKKKNKLLMFFNTSDIQMFISIVNKTTSLQKELANIVLKYYLKEEVFANLSALPLSSRMVV